MLNAMSGPAAITSECLRLSAANIRPLSPLHAVAFELTADWIDMVALRFTASKHPLQVVERVQSLGGQHEVIYLERIRAKA